MTNLIAHACGSALPKNIALHKFTSRRPQSTHHSPRRAAKSVVQHDPAVAPCAGGAGEGFEQSGKEKNGLSIPFDRYQTVSPVKAL
jgi:hypothetical protein